MTLFALQTVLNTWRRLKPGILCASLSIAALAQFYSHARAGELPGYDRIDIHAKHRSTLVAGSVWYPAGSQTYHSLVGDNPVFQGTRAMLGATVKDGKYPLLVLSHGSGGNMDGLSWLSSELAKSGIMVLGMNHPGSTSNDSSPRRSAQFWDRAQDTGAALDEILADPVYGPHIDRDRIYMLGFSLGGVNTLQNIGMRADIHLYEKFCTQQPQSPGCVFFAKGGVDWKAVDAERIGASYEEPRLAGAIAVDPGMHFAMTPESVAAVKKPVLFINLGSDDTLWDEINVGPTGSNLAAHLAGAEYVQIAPADHFTFLGLCKENAAQLLKEENDDPVCTDPKGADRADIHRRVIDAVTQFIKKEGAPT
ncbi:alpha/beta hydrolase family protein [Roseibium litorale]|uniref:Alpha/beta hydrolase n=1 Tax=Roseibium litorale TaxID=2803841 RepID=A0ABR9CR39_9HYPH|nr:alpha/beta hydrolase [Roseibium litorale]MBD8893253.1 alpha/beta hydrolase [Roseibium litorale]